LVGHHTHFYVELFRRLSVGFGPLVASDRCIPFARKMGGRSGKRHC
jgi:hypothetical protein